MFAQPFNRRRFFRATFGAAAAIGAAPAWCGGLPPVTAPRATDGDEAFEPDWEERLTITVGPTKADLVGSGERVIQRTLVARSGNRFKLSDGLRKNIWLSGGPTCSSLFPLLTSENAADVVIENLTLDGNGKNNENLNGNYGGGIFLQDCNRFTIRKVEVRDFWPNRNLLEGNVIFDSGGEEGVAIDITGKVRDLRIVGNEIRETRGPARRIGIRIGKDAGSVEMDGNTIEGFAAAVSDLRARQ